MAPSNRAPDKPGVYVFTEDDRLVFVGRIGNLHKRLGLHRSSHPKLRALAGKMARIQDREDGVEVQQVREQCDVPVRYRRRFQGRVRRGDGPDPGPMEVRYITVPEDEDAGALRALVQLHVAVELSTLQSARRRVRLTARAGIAAGR